MSTARTAISLPGDLLEEVDRRARECDLSRSAFIKDALEAHLSRLREAELRRQLAEAYAQPETDDETAERRAFERASRRATEQEPW